MMPLGGVIGLELLRSGLAESETNGQGRKWAEKGRKSAATARERNVYH
jgi:hypothetical protein